VAVEMEAAALYAYAMVRERDVICVAHVTNTMATGDDDFDKAKPTPPTTPSRSSPPSSKAGPRWDGTRPLRARHRARVQDPDHCWPDASDTASRPRCLREPNHLDGDASTTGGQGRAGRRFEGRSRGADHGRKGVA
jgi:hypothetical protein